MMTVKTVKVALLGKRNSKVIYWATIWINEHFSPSQEVGVELMDAKGKINIFLFS